MRHSAQIAQPQTSGRRSSNDKYRHAGELARMSKQKLTPLGVLRARRRSMTSHG